MLHIIIQRLCFLHCGLIKTHGDAHEKHQHAQHPACSYPVTSAIVARLGACPATLLTQLHCGAD